MKTLGACLMKAAINALVISSVILSSIPQAFAGAAPVLDEAPPTSVQAHAGRTLDLLLSRSTVQLALESMDLDGLRERAAKAAKEMPREAAVGVGQTFIVMMILAGVEMTAQQIQKNGGHHPTPSQLAQIAHDVATATVNSPLIMTSILTAGGFTMAGQVAAALGKVFLHPKLRAAFVPVLSHAITATIGFVGWDFGAQLWTEASLMLKSPTDYKIAANAFGMSKGLLTTALAANAHSTSALDQQRARVAKQMMQNMLLILSEPDLRRQLVYNFLRTDVMTGEFQTMLVSFIASGAIGTAIFPGGGTVVGLIFGAIGIVAAQFIPQKQKDQITNGWQALRAGTLRSGLFWNTNQLKGDLLPATLSQADGFAQLKQHIKARRTLRSHWATVEWEHMYLEARAHADLSKRLPFHFDKIKKFYVSEFATLRDLENGYPIAMEHADIKALFEAEKVRMSAMIDFFETLSSAAAMDPSNTTIIKSIDASESRGFNEDYAILAWTQGAEGRRATVRSTDKRVRS